MFGIARASNKKGITLMSDQIYSPSNAFSEKALVSSMNDYQNLYNNSIKYPEAFWAEVADRITWTKKMGQCAGLRLCQRADQMVRRWKTECKLQLLGPSC